MCCIWVPITTRCSCLPPPPASCMNYPSNSYPSALSPSTLLLGDFNIHVDSSSCKFAADSIRLFELYSTFKVLLIKRPVCLIIMPSFLFFRSPCLNIGKNDPEHKKCQRTSPWEHDPHRQPATQPKSAVFNVTFFSLMTLITATLNFLRPKSTLSTSSSRCLSPLHHLTSGYGTLC